MDQTDRKQLEMKIKVTSVKTLGSEAKSMECHIGQRLVICMSLFNFPRR